MSKIAFSRDLDFEYGTAAQVSPLIRRVVAQNPGSFTLHGTGTYIVGKDAVAVIDPGPEDDDHLQAILRAVEGQKITHIVVTHTHRDHSPLAKALKAETGALIVGCGRHGDGRGPKGDHVEEGADRDYEPEIQMRDGDLAAGAGWTLKAVATPGHTSNHLCFELMEENSLFSGDHVMGWSTTIVSPPDGDMLQYMQSLEKLLHRSDKRYWPTHGPAVDGPQDFVRSLLAHRHARERQILNCLNQDVCEIPKMVAEMYTDVPEHLHSAAARSVLSHLIHMVDTNRVDCDGDPGPESSYRHI